MTTPELFAIATGTEFRTGPHRCFYCGAMCGEHNPTKRYVKSSFTGLDTVFAPGSEYVCDGCVACMQEKGDVTLIDGKRRSGQKLRCYSWLITEQHARAATKTHREWIRSLCLLPPKPPFSLVLSDSGQRHLLYRGVVCHSRDVVTVTLEAEPITYHPVDLQARIDLCEQVIAATGKPALAEPLSPRAAMAIGEHHGDPSLPLEWMRVREQGLSRLATWLSGPKEECLGKYPRPADPDEDRRDDNRRVSQKTLWTR